MLIFAAVFVLGASLAQPVVDGQRLPSLQSVHIRTECPQGNVEFTYQALPGATPRVIRLTVNGGPVPASQLGALERELRGRTVNYVSVLDCGDARNARVRFLLNVTSRDLPTPSRLSEFLGFDIRGDQIELHEDGGLSSE